MPQKTILTAFCILGMLAPISRTYASGQNMTHGDCPDRATGETPEDCPWAGLARRLVRAVSANESISDTLTANTPSLAEKFHEDRDRKDWLSLWGRSLNFDELAHDVILNPAIIRALGVELGGPVPDGRIVHAGIEHTYGYLFSLLKTPYGFKRARWVRPTIDRGFGFHGATISPLPVLGTLLGNATYFFGHIAFRGEKARLAALAAHPNAIPPELSAYDYGKLDVRRIEERVRIPAGKDGVGRWVTLRTDLVAFPHPIPNESNTHLLVYSVNDPELGGSVLITAFPVTKAFVGTALNTGNLGPDQPIISRYNAYVTGLTGGLRGTRKVIIK